MTLLFGSDFHGRPEAWDRFADELRSGPWAVGVLGGDLLEDVLPPDQVDALLGPDPEADLDELGGPDDDPVAVWQSSGARARLMTALAARVEHLQTKLATAGKPVVFVLGNHDRVPWPDRPWMTNLHERVIEIGDWKFAGYRWTNFERTSAQIEADLTALQTRVDERTILVTHSPPYGILDEEDFSGLHFGLPGWELLKPQPWLHLFGHVHGRAGHQGHFVNGSWPRTRTFVGIEVETRRVWSV